MRIRRKISDKLEIYVAEKGRIRITLWDPMGSGRCRHVNVSLTPTQAINVASALMRPPECRSVERLDGTISLCPMWQIYKVRHGNGSTRGMIGVSNDGGRLLGLNGDLTSFGKDEDETRVTDYFPCIEIKLTEEEVKTVVGLLFLWAGSKFIGTRKVCKTITENILNTDDEKR